MKKFNSRFWFRMLQNLSEAPEDQISVSLTSRMKNFLSDSSNDNPLSVWNFYKEVLDIGVHTGGISGFVLGVVDLESFYTPPEGSYCQSDASINEAPWRKDKVGWVIKHYSFDDSFCK